MPRNSQKRSRPGFKSLVPIAHLTSMREDVSVECLSRIRDLKVPRGLHESAARILGRSHFESLDSADAVVRHVSRAPGAVGLVPWDAVDPRVRALAVNGKPLLEPGASVAGRYPLLAGPASGPDPRELRRIVVAGDIVMDRGMPRAVFNESRGINFPLDGGHAGVTGRVPVPSQASEFGILHQFEAGRRGEAGAVRRYLRRADLMLANLENPILKDATYHPSGPTFNGDLRLLPVLEAAGIDGVTLANNHILDAGPRGLEETLRHLKQADILHAGAGPSLEAARDPMIFDLDGLRVGVLSYQGVPDYEWAWASETTAGTAPMNEELMSEDIRRLRRRVDVVVVMPHWGLEYTATPEPQQIRFAHGAVDQGADLVVGSHAHWPKGIEIYQGKPIFYGTGNFLFDQPWSEETSTGILAEFILCQDRIVQARPIPFIILDGSQPNFLVPEAGGEWALFAIFSTSLGPEFEHYKRC